MKLAHKYFLALNLVALLLLPSCAYFQKETLSGLPSWYVKPKDNDLEKLYGVGEGFTLEEASKSALKSLAGKLMVTISSESTMLLESNQFATNQETRQKISELVAKMTFTNYRISNSVEIKNKIYAEIAVDRDDFIKDYSEKLFTLNQKMADLYKYSSNKTILERRNDLAAINDVSLEAESIIHILRGIGAYSSSSPSYKENLNRYNLYRNSYNLVLNKIEFFIKPNKVSSVLNNVIIAALNKEKIKIATDFNANNSNLVVIDLKTNLVSHKIYGANIAKLKVNLSLISNKNKILTSNNIELVGNSMISEEEASNVAALSLAQKIDEQGILLVLGIAQR